MRRAGFRLAQRLAQAARNGADTCGRAAAGAGSSGTTRAAVRVASAAAAATAAAAAVGTQWALAEAQHPQQPRHAPHQQQGEQQQQHVDVQLEEQSVAISNSATAQWRVFTDMGRELVQQGRLGEAERYFKKAVEMAREGFGETDPHMASACNNLAEFYRLRRRYDDAEPLYKQALEILTRTYGLHDARVAFALHNLGGFYFIRRQLDRAAECYEQALKMKLEVLGTGHSETSNTMNHLAEVRWQQGQHALAVQLMEHSLEIMESQGVGAMPGCVRRRGRLAEMQLERGNVEEAEKLLRAILVYVESAQCLEHANYAAAAENLSAALQRRGSWDEARSLMHRALETRTTHVGARHPVVAVTLRKLAELELAAADAEEAAASRAGNGGAPGQGGGSGAGGSSSAAGSQALPPAEAPLQDRERQQAVAIADEALSIALQAYSEAVGAQRRQGQPEEGGLLAWLRPKPTLSVLRRPQRPDAAALEVAQSYRTLARAHVATAAPTAAEDDLGAALDVLAEAFPRAQQAQQAQQQQAVAEEQAASADSQAGAALAGDASGEGSNGGTEAEAAVEEAEEEARSASSVVAAISAREAARAVRVEKARHELACGLLADLLVLVQQGGGGGGGGGLDACAMRQRWAAEGCDAPALEGRAYGDFEKLRELSDAEPEALHRPDEQGFYALQWASLNNRVAVLTYLLDKGCDANAADGTGQTALHWSGVRGSTAAMETLLRGGADLEARDSRGYTVCHVAAQYGQTATLYHLAQRWNAEMDSLDNDGRSPLHWAAYKGFADTLRLLLVLGSRVNLPDKEGCTPLHWAAIRGHTEACTVLLQGGAEEALMLADSTGSTPSQLAIEKGHRLLGLHLAEYKYRQDRKRAGSSGLWAVLDRLHLSPIIWIIIMSMLGMMAYSVIENEQFPRATAPELGAAWLTVLLASAGLYFLYLTTSADPGFIPLNQGRTPSGSAAGSSTSSSKAGPVGGSGGSSGGAAASKGSIALQRWDSNGKQSVRGGGGSARGSGSAVLDNPALAAGHWGQLCVSCRIVRPLRAKHCSVTGRCVETFDHYCPWVGNAIGRGNRHLFLTFLWLELGAILVSTLLGVVRIHAAVVAAQQHEPGSGRHLILIGPVMFCVFDIFLLISVAALAIAQASQARRRGDVGWERVVLATCAFLLVSLAALAIAQALQVARNVTTNELANWHRYKYLHGTDGDFHNPFDHGWRRNCGETCKPRAAPAPPFVLRADDSETMALLQDRMEAGGG